MKLAHEIDDRAWLQPEPRQRPAPSVLLLVAATPAAAQCAHLLQESGFHVELVDEAETCVRRLHACSFELLLVEDTLLSGDPAIAERLYAIGASCAVVELNFGLTEPGRIVGQVRAALRRRELDVHQAQVCARRQLQGELTASLTGLLLEAQLALRQTGSQAAPALQRLVDLAEHVCAVIAEPSTTL